MGDGEAVLIDESAELMSLANSAGFRCFTTAEAFRQYVIEKLPVKVVAQNLKLSEARVYSIKSEILSRLRQELGSLNT